MRAVTPRIVISDSTGDIYPVIPLATVIRNTLLNALASTSGDQAKAARALGISSRAMNYSMVTYDIPLASAGRVRATPMPTQLNPRLTFVPRRSSLKRVI